MKKISVLLLFLLGTFFSIAQNFEFYKMVPFKKGNKWGVMSRQKEVFYPAQLDTFLFQETEEGMASLFVPDDEKQLMVAKVVYKGKPMYLTGEGKLLPASFNYKPEPGPKFTPPRIILDEDSNEVTEESKDPSQFAEGLIVDSFSADLYGKLTVKVAKHDNGFRFLLNGVHEPAFDCNSYIKYYNNGLVGFALLKKDGKYGCANFRLRRLVAPPEYDEINFDGGPGLYFYVKKGDLYGVINREGKMLVPVQYKEITTPDAEDYQEIKAFIVRKDNGYCLYDTESGEDKNVYDLLMYLYGNYHGEMLYLAEKGRNSGILKADGTIVVPFNYSMITPTEKGDVFRLQQGKQHSYFIVRSMPYLLGEKYTRISAPIRYHSEETEDNYYLFFAQLNGKWFLVDSYGTEFIE